MIKIYDELAAQKRAALLEAGKRTSNQSPISRVLCA
jgi:hypothetical protein